MYPFVHSACLNTAIPSLTWFDGVLPEKKKSGLSDKVLQSSFLNNAAIETLGRYPKESVMMGTLKSGSSC